MEVEEAIRQRRSIKRFSSDPVPREAVEKMIAAATLAPNHRLTQPWRFYVMGPDAREAYGRALGVRKAKKIEDSAAAEAMRESVAMEHRALPGMIAIAVVNHENPEIREEDYAAAMMAIQNMALAAVSLGLGTHIKTGGVMQDPAARAAVDITDDQRIVAIVNVGVPAEVPPPRQRLSPEACTSWSA
jgi:nitroreductase